MPRLSVIIPVKNGERTISRALRSTLRALPPDAQVAVFDDGSTDQTREEIEAIRDARIVIFSSERSVGVGTALNLLLAKTDSEYVARMDADDVVMPGRFRYQQQAVNDRTPVNFTSVYNWVPERKRIYPTSSHPINARSFPYHLLLTNPVSHPTFFARRTALDAVGCYRNVPAEDYDLWLRMASKGIGMRRLALPMLAYRLHPDQVTSSVPWRNSSWRNPETAVAFAQLSEKLLGQAFTRLTTLGSTTTLSSGSVERSLLKFSVLFRDSVKALPPLDRRLLLRKLDTRLRAVRAMVSARRTDWS